MNAVSPTGFVRQYRMCTAYQPCTSTAKARSAASAMPLQRRKPRKAGVPGPLDEGGRPSAGAGARTPGRCGAARRATGGSSRRPARSACRGRPRCAPRRARLRPAHELRGLVGVDQVVGERAGSEHGAGPVVGFRRQPDAGRVDHEVELVVTQCRGGDSLIGPSGANWAASADRLRRGCGWSPRGCAADQSSSGPSMPRAAPPAPSTRMRRSRRSSPRFSIRSRTSPAPSVLSPYQRPSGSSISVFTAPASCARLECSEASANASTLNGTVTLRPRPPSWRTPRPSRRTRRAARAGARRPCPRRSSARTRSGSAATSNGATGLPMTA